MMEQGISLIATQCPVSKISKGNNPLLIATGILGMHKCVDVSAGWYELPLDSVWEVIANALAYMKIIERWGSGIPRIYRI